MKESHRPPPPPPPPLPITVGRGVAAQDFPPGSRWSHKSDRSRVCVVVRIEPGTLGPQLFYRYERTAGGMGSSRATPVQSMALEMWRGIFTRPAP